MTRIYADTSVFGGVFDDEFKAPSQTLFNQIQIGLFQLVTSVLVQQELQEAPASVRNFFNNQLPDAEVANISAEALQLQEAYLKAGVVTEKWSEDALHVAIAVMNQCTLIVSWNFKHIVHYEKIAQYNNVNITEGYNEISIHSPQEVITYEDEDI